MSELGTPATYEPRAYVSNGTVHHTTRFGRNAGLLIAYIAILGAWYGLDLLVASRIPVLGSHSAPVFIIGIVALVFLPGLLFRRLGVWSGACPHCGGTIAVKPPAEPSRLFDCPLCKGRTVLDEAEGRFRVHGPDDQVAPSPDADAAPEKQAS